jgi:hypothetical protein
VIGGIALAPLAILAFDWTLWRRIDDAMSGAIFPRAPWRWRNRRWGPWAAIWLWVAAGALLRDAPSSQALVAAMVGCAIVIMAWWIYAIYRNLRR